MLENWTPEDIKWLNTLSEAQRLEIDRITNILKGVFVDLEVVQVSSKNPELEH